MNVAEEMLAIAIGLEAQGHADWADNVLHEAALIELEQHQRSQSL